MLPAALPLIRLAANAARHLLPPGEKEKSVRSLHEAKRNAGFTRTGDEDPDCAALHSGGWEGEGNAKLVPNVSALSENALPHGEERRAATRLEPCILRDADLRSAPQDEDIHSSCAGLTRASIRQTRECGGSPWIAGSSPAMTKYMREPADLIRSFPRKRESTLSRCWVLLARGRTGKSKRPYSFVIPGRGRKPASPESIIASLSVDSGQPRCARLPE